MAEQIDGTTQIDFTKSTFFERYNYLCSESHCDPCGNDITKAVGVNKATISVWKSAKTVPKGETVRKIADRFNVSCDFLLGRTNDSTDYTVGKKALLPARLLRKLEALDDLDLAMVESYIDGLSARRRES